MAANAADAAFTERPLDLCTIPDEKMSVLPDH